MFDVTFRSLHIRYLSGVTASAESAETWRLLSPESQSAVKDIYDAVRSKFIEFSRSDERDVLVEIRRSVFGLCLKEGFLLFKADADASLRGIVFDGFLIPQTELRSAWQLARWQILVMAAGGWQTGGKITLTVPQIQAEADAALERITEFDLLTHRRDTFLEQLQEVGKDMIESAMPFTFTTAADDIRSSIGLDLTTGYRRAEIRSTGTGEIPIAVIDVETLSAKHMARCGFDDIRLDSMAEEEYFGMLLAQSEKVYRKDALRRIREDIAQARKEGGYPAYWCYIFTKGEVSFARRIEPEDAPSFYADGTVPYSVLYSCFISAKAEANDYFAKLDMMPAENAGLFGFLFGKKKSE
ncbi:MAG: hypothetical protein IJ251_02650 [Oscillospiraceae bacterium]|nr:hypothetical protein [Oscillospiraceae bacterium]